VAQELQFLLVGESNGVVVGLLNGANLGKAGFLILFTVS
jgi:hypothetical protein